MVNQNPKRIDATIAKEKKLAMVCISPHWKLMIKQPKIGSELVLPKGLAIHVPLVIPAVLLLNDRQEHQLINVVICTMKIYNFPNI